VLGEWGKDANRVINADWDAPLRWDRRAAKLGERHRVFPSLCDPFEDREDLVDARQRFLDLIASTPNLDWLILTKRPENALRLLREVAVSKRIDRGSLTASGWLAEMPPRNVWLGVSVENQEYADKRLPILAEIPAALRWVSYEPAIGPISIGDDESGFIDWLVCGGESESPSKARPFDLAWARSIRDECKADGIAFFMKQFGSSPWSEGCDGDRRMIFKDPKGGDIDEFPEELRIRQFPDVVGRV